MSYSTKWHSYSYSKLPRKTVGSRTSTGEPLEHEADSKFEFGFEFEFEFGFKFKLGFEFG